MLLLLVLLQIGIEIATLLHQVPLSLALSIRAARFCLPALWNLHVARLADRLIQIGDDVVDVLDADRQADHVRSGAGALQLIGGQAGYASSRPDG